MSLFRKIFGTSDASSKEEKDSDSSLYLPEQTIPVDELFTLNFKKNGGKFIYCENIGEVREQFENILEENDWYESEAACYEPQLYSMLDDNRISYLNISNPRFLFASCENLIADDGSVLFSSKQIKQHKPHELPSNIVILATTSQMVETKSDGMRAIKKKYDKEYPSNITTVKYFEKAKEEDFLQYGSSAKNLYLLLLEDL